MSKMLYTPEDLAGFDYARDLGNPGEYPFIRGIYPEMYLRKKPTIRMFSGLGTAETTNERFKKELALGVTGLSIAVDMATLMGLDSDNPICEGYVGYDGVAISTLQDMRILLDGIPQDKVTTSMTINGPSAVLLAMYVVLAQERGIPLDKIGGTAQTDILKEYIAQKEWLFPIGPSMRLIGDMMEFCSSHMPKWHPISISGYHIREAGSTAIQEVAYTLAAGIAYARHAISRGMNVDDFAPQFSFFVDVHNNRYEEIAKIRAMRRLWAKIMKEWFHAQNPKSQWMRVHAQTAGCTLTAQEPLNNLTRVSLQALSAMEAGVQSLHTNSYDEVFFTPTEQAVHLAIRTQQILQEESGVCEVIDPWAGSYMMESLTNQIEKEALAEIEVIENLGGMEKAVEAGYPQKMIRTSAMVYQRKVESGEVGIVGVNKYNDGASKFASGVSAKVLKEFRDRQKDVEARQLARLSETKSNRNNADVLRALDNLRTAAGTNQNLMPFLIEAVKTYATLGEICQTLKEVFGEYKEREAEELPVVWPQDFLRVLQQHKLDKPVRILLAKSGLDGHDRGIHILRTLFKYQGAEVIYSGLHRSIGELASIACQEDVDMIGLSVLTGDPIIFFEKLLSALKQFGRDDMKLFGGGIVRPFEEKTLKKIGVRKVFLPNATLVDCARYLKEEADKL